MTLENEKRFLLLMSSYSLLNEVTKSRVLDKIEAEEWMVFSDKDLQVKHNRNELRWRNDLAFTRKHLAQLGLFQSAINNNWAITPDGISELSTLCSQVIKEGNLRKVSSSARANATRILQQIEENH